jgi:hypothetical protein
MKPDNTRDRSNSSNRAAKAMSAIPAIGIVVAASLLLLSGLSTIGSYHSVLAQQAMPQGGGINANITAGEGNATTTTTGGAAGGNQSEARMHLEEVRTALQNNDVQGAMMHLDLAMNLLGGGTQGNMASTTGSTNSTA